MKNKTKNTILAIVGIIMFIILSVGLLLKLTESL